MAHAPNILAFILLTRQISKMGMDQFHIKVDVKYAICGDIVDLLPLDKCFTTNELTSDAASLSQVSNSKQTTFPRAIYTRAMWWAQTINPNNPIESIGRGQGNLSPCPPNRA